MTNSVRNCFFLACLSLCSTASLAYTSLAMVQGDMKTLSAAWDVATQSDADRIALSSCTQVSKGKLCQIVLRSVQPGYGAYVCGKKDCGISTGAEFREVANSLAYVQCTNATTNCDRKKLVSWGDFAWPPVGNQQNAAQSGVYRNLSTREQELATMKQQMEAEVRARGDRTPYH